VKEDAEELIFDSIEVFDSKNMSNKL